MTSTVYTDLVGPAVNAAWLNDVDTATYTTVPNLGKKVNTGLAIGTTDAWTSSISISSYVSGMLIGFYFYSTNTATAPTVNVNGLGAVTITDSKGSALVAGQIPTGVYVWMTYNANGPRFEILGRDSVPLPPVFNYVAGRYYNPCLSGASIAWTSIANITHFVPYIQYTGATIAGMSIACTAFTSLVNARVGIYRESAGLPSTLLTTIGTVAITSIGIKDVVGAYALPAGRYFLAVQLDGTTVALSGSSTSFATSVFTNPVMGFDYAGQTAFNNAAAQGYSQAQPYASGFLGTISVAPSTTPGTTTQPIIMVKM